MPDNNRSKIVRLLRRSDNAKTQVIFWKSLIILAVSSILTNLKPKIILRPLLWAGLRSVSLKQPLSPQPRVASQSLIPLRRPGYPSNITQCVNSPVHNNVLRASLRQNQLDGFVLSQPQGGQSGLGKVRIDSHAGTWWFFQKRARIRTRGTAYQAVDKARIPTDSITLIIKVALAKGTNPGIINHSRMGAMREKLPDGVYVEDKDESIEWEYLVRRQAGGRDEHECRQWNLWINSLW